MKTVKSIFTSMILALMVSASVMAQSEPKVVAVVNKADWCPVCKENGERAMAAFMNNNKDGAIKFVANDLTTAETRDKSAEELKSIGLDLAAGKVQGTGLVSFFNPKTKALLNQISVSSTDAELAAAMLTAKKEIK
ncbi:MAG: hypothetical protein IPJ16_00110 [Bacteroidales bacterium]|nr:hypothetical protein [Bacteroidales bacterium]